MTARKINRAVDRVFEKLLTKLGCLDGRDAILIAHWQDGTNPGFRIQVTRRSDRHALTQFVNRRGAVSP